MNSSSKDLIVKMAKKAGINIGGSDPWDIQVHDERFYDRVIKHGTLGLGEAYMDGWWSSKQLDVTFYKLISADLRDDLKKDLSAKLLLLSAVILNKAKTQAFEVGQKHYDIGNELYETMLDKRMVYTCGYWENAQTLDEAQEAKLDLVCKKIGLKSGDRILDIGCGWGSFLEFAAENYGVTGAGLTVSKEQQSLAQNRLKNYNIQILLEDYRNHQAEPYDHIVSLGMFEHVGYKNYRKYMEMVAKNLKDDGLFLLHTIGNDKSVKTTDLWIEKYIFPNSMLPSLAQISKSIEKLFIVEDVHNFGADYDTTLMAWHKNVFDNKEQLSKFYDDRFFRMWDYYLLSCAGLFRARKTQLWQIVLSKKGLMGGYKRIS